MISLQILIGDASCRFAANGQSVVVPVGPAALTRAELTADPPRAEQLTNAIGVVLDHLDDVIRELPAVLAADEVRLAGADVRAIACVEAGGDVDDRFVLQRAAAEDVFRTLATEARRDRARNPGLAAERVDTVVGGCCVVVAVMRHLHLDEVTIEPGDLTDDDHPVAAAGAP